MKCEDLNKENRSLNDTVMGNMKRIEDLQSEVEREILAFKDKESELFLKNNVLEDKVEEQKKRLLGSGHNFNALNVKKTEIENSNKNLEKEISDIRKLQGNDKDLNLAMLTLLHPGYFIPGRCGGIGRFCLPCLIFLICGLLGF